MIHARTQIRQKLAQLLYNNTSAGSNVFQARAYALDDTKLPALLVYTKQEAIGQTSISYPRTQQRDLQLTIEIYMKARGIIDDQIDSLALEVEKIIANDPSFDGLVKDSVLDTTETTISDDGEIPVAIAVLNYAVMYTVKEHEPHNLT